MRKILIPILVALSVGVCLQTSDAFADGVPVKRQIKRAVLPPTCVHSRCFIRRPVCPDRYSCYSLYGAYGPYGGRAYWTRFTFAGWGYR